MSTPTKETGPSEPQATAERPAAVQPPFRKRSGVRRFLFLQFLNVVVFVGAGASLVWLHGKYTKTEGRNRSEEVARYELRRFLDVFNHRLNTLREELVAIYWQQSQLARVLNDAERERFVFYRRDHLAALGVLVAGTGGWELQKYYLRENSRKEGADPDKVVALLKGAMDTVKPPGFGILRAGLDPRLLGATWSGGQAAESDAYALAFASTDEAGRPFGVVGIFRPSYVFPFCHAFGDALGAMPVSTFILNDAGTAVCHSQAQNEGLSFKDYSFYTTLTDPPPSGVVHYSNLVNNDVAAAVKKADTGRLTFVVEAVEVSPWVSAVPFAQLQVVAGAVFVLIMGFSFYAARTFVGRGPDGRDFAQAPGSDGPDPKTDALGVELSEFTKLRRELKELETTVLEMQGQHAFVAAFHRGALELASDADLAQYAIDRLADWGLPVAWLSYDREGGKLHAGPRRNWGGEGAPEPNVGFQIAVGKPGQWPADAFTRDAGVRKKIETQLGRSDLEIQKVARGEQVLAVLVLAGGRAAKPGVSAAPPPQAEILPEIAQTLALIHCVRGATEGSS